MHPRPRPALAILTLGLLLLASGCASFRSGEHEGASLLSADVRPALQITLRVRAETKVDGSKVEPSKWWRGFLRIHVFNGFEYSDYFTAVHYGTKPSERYVDVTVESDGESKRGYHHFASLLRPVLPSRSSGTVTVTCEFRMPDGERLGTFSKSERIDTWDQVFLVFLAPFALPRDVHAATIEDLTAAILHEAAATGIFRRRPAPPAQPATPDAETAPGAPGSE